MAQLISHCITIMTLFAVQNNFLYRNVETEVADLEKLIHASREATKARSGSTYSQENVI